MNSQEDDPLFKVGVPSTRKVEQKTSGWLGGYVKTPAMLGGSDNSSYTVYILKTQITNPENLNDVQEYEVQRRFSDFEKFLAILR